MKFTINPKNLLKSLDCLEFIPEKGANESLISHVLIKATKDNIITLSVSDRENFLSTSLVINQDIETIEEYGQATVPYHLLKNLVAFNASHQHNTITITAKEGTATLDNGKAVSTFVSTSGNSYPVVEIDDESSNYLELPQNMLKKAIGNVEFCIAQKASIPGLNCLKAEFYENQMILVGADHPRLGMTEYVYPESSLKLEADIAEEVTNTNALNVLLSLKTYKSLSKMLLATDATIRVDFICNRASEINKVVFTTDEFRLVSTLGNTKYPQYKKTIPTEFFCTIIAPIKELITTLEYLRINIPKDDTPCRLTFNKGDNTAPKASYEANGIISISSKSDIDKSNFSEEIAAEVNFTEEYEKDSTTANLNPKILLEALKRLENQSDSKTGDAKVQINIPKNMYVQVHDPDAEEITSSYIIMPIL